MSITKYVTDGPRWSVKAEITPVPVERESEKSVWINGRRSEKRGDFSVHHDTWEAAHAFLMDIAQNKVNAARRQLEIANSLLGNVKGMKQ